MSTMHDVAALPSIDMNLLVALEALLRLRSVTRAARQLAVTQSAMSHTLRRLRETFDDPILVRGGAGMVATPRAAAMTAPLRAALVGLSRAIAPAVPFEPAVTTRVFRLVSPDLFDVLVFPRLLRQLAAHAPSATLAALPSFDRLLERLETGELDVAIVPVAVEAGAERVGPPLPPDLLVRRLFDDGYAAFVRAGHPALAAPRLSPRAFAALAHILVSPTGQGEGQIDALLAKRGIRRRIVLRVPLFGSAIAVAQETDAVLIAPAGLVARAPRLGLRTLPLPVRLPRHGLALVWHPRFDAEPGHAWLRAQILESVADLRQRSRAE